MHQYAGKASVLKQVLKYIEHLRMPDRRNLEVFPGSCCSSKNKYARPDNGPNAQGRK